MSQQPGPAARIPAPVPAATPLDELPTDADVRLVVADMDGTLLDAAGRVPEGLWPLLDTMRERQIVFAPASGRQYATLRELFASHAHGMPFIAENGTFVVRDGRELGSTTLDRGFVTEAVGRLRGLAASGRDLGVVLCGKRSAHVERTDEPFMAECRRYYRELQEVGDVLAVDDEVLKLAVYDFGDAEGGTAPHLADLRDTHQVVVSGEHWIDLMSQRANKGVAVEQLQRALGVTRAQTVTFGDYLNDYELMGAADLSFAMANGHERVIGAARHVAPANTDGGVVTVLRRLLGLGADTGESLPA